MKYKIIKITRQGSKKVILYDVFDDEGVLVVGNLLLDININTTEKERDKLLSDTLSDVVENEVFEEKLYTQEEVDNMISKALYKEKKINGDL